MANLTYKYWLIFHAWKIDRFIIQIIKIYTYFTIVRLKLNLKIINCYYYFIIYWIKKEICKSYFNLKGPIPIHFSIFHTFFWRSSCRLDALNIYMFDHEEEVCNTIVQLNELTCKWSSIVIVWNASSEVIKSHPGPLSTNLYRCPVRDCSTRSARKMASAQCAPTMENITPRA